MLRNICCLILLLSPLAARAQDEPRHDSQNRVISVEVTIFAIAGGLDIEGPDEVDMETLHLAIQASREAGNLQHLTRMRLSTLDTVKAMAQLGATQSVATNRVTLPPRGSTPARVATNYQTIDTGSIIEVLPRLDDQDNIILNLDISDSRLVPAPATDDLTPAPTDVAQLTLQSTVKLTSGQAMLISGSQEVGAEGDPTNTYVVVRATVAD